VTKSRKSPSGIACFSDALERVDAVADPVHRRLGEVEDAEEKQRHHRGEHEPAPDGMSDDGIDFVRGGRAGGAGAKHDIGRDVADGVVARVDQRAGPVGPLAFPALFPVVQEFLRAFVQRRRARDAQRILDR